MLDRARGLPRLLRALLRLATQRVPAVDLDRRLENLPCVAAPLAADLEIRWSPQAIPFISAANLDDLAVGLGVVHAHLRLAQMELMRRLATGRLSELMGSVTFGLDIALRTLDLGRAIPGILEQMPPSTRRWLECYLAGINHVMRNAPMLPPEFRVFEIERTAWSLEDLLAVARLAAADITWSLSLQLLKVRERLPRDAWAALWPGLLEDGMPAPAGGLLLNSRGSNSVAVAGCRTLSGKAMIASDPHVSVQLPSIWVACGMSAPGMHAVGLTVPGLPSIAIGRNQSIAWGATNMHAASSVLVDLTREADARIHERPIEIAVRGARPRRLNVRESRFGPVISDIKGFGLKRPTALAWVGHRPSDETSAMLAVNRAADLPAFRAALRGSAVQGYNFTYADESGCVTLVRAAHVPNRRMAPDDLLEAGEVMNDIVCLDAESTEPKLSQSAADGAAHGVVVSANENPRTAVAAGFFFAPPDRAQRLAELLNRTHLTLHDLHDLQTDVASRAALRLRDAVAARAARLSLSLPAALLEWDGRYTEASVGALAYEILIGEAAERVISAGDLEPLLAVWTGRGLIGARLLASSDTVLRPALGAAARLAGDAVASGRTWGDAHRILVRHPFARLPLVGRKFDSREFGVAGSNDTIYKTGHGLLRWARRRGVHRVSYGASARHISDFKDLDDNFVVLAGGQDGWPGSENAADQLQAWAGGKYFQLPLRGDTVNTMFTRLTRLTKGSS